MTAKFLRPSRFWTVRCCCRKLRSAPRVLRPASSPSPSVAGFRFAVLQAAFVTAPPPVPARFLPPRPSGPPPSLCPVHPIRRHAGTLCAAASRLPLCLSGFILRGKASTRYRRRLRRPPPFLHARGNAGKRDRRRGEVPAHHRQPAAARIRSRLSLSASLRPHRLRRDRLGNPNISAQSSGVNLPARFAAGTDHALSFSGNRYCHGEQPPLTPVLPVAAGGPPRPTVSAPIRWPIRQ